MIPHLSRRLHLLIPLLILLAACSAPRGAAEDGPPLEPCRLPGDVAAQCGTLTVSENRQSPDGRMIGIHFAVVPAESSISDPDPVFMLAGGPGQAATEAYPPLLGSFDTLRQNRDVVLVDQRGTGQSHPLDCPDLEALPLDADEDEVLAVLEACRQRLAQQANLTQYMTDVAMQDLDDVRQALGYEQINLIGGSYGSRAALRYMRLFPDNVRTAVLDSVVGTELILLLQAPADGQRALELLFERCRDDDACHNTFPEFEATFREVREGLDGGRDVTLQHPTNGRQETLTMDEETWMQGIFSLLYRSELVALLPLMVDDVAETGDYGPLVAQMIALTADQERSPGMFQAVACSEDAALIDLQEAQEIRGNSPFPLVANEFVEQCQNWPRAEVAASFREPLNSDIPTLLLSGEADPITPPRYAEQVAQELSNSHSITLPGFGHGVLAVGCMPDVVTDFIGTGTPEGLDTGCVDEITPPPFFVSPTGPRP